MEKLCGIYCIENLINGKKYIGLSVDIVRRFYKHRYCLNKNIHYNSHLQNAWNEYGSENFEFYTVEECSPNVLSEREKYYIGLFKSNDTDYGYNADPGGKSTTDEIRRRLSETAKGNFWSDEKRKALSLKMSGYNNPMYGKRHSAESLQKIKDTRADMRGENNPMYGKHHTEEAKRIISIKKKGTKPPTTAIEANKQRTGTKHPRHRPVYCPELDRTFWGPTEVENEGITKSSYVSAVLIGKQKTAGKHPLTGEPLHWIDASDRNIDF